jgi:transketolase
MVRRAAGNRALRRPSGRPGCLTSQASLLCPSYGTALAALGGLDNRVVALDSDVKNSTFSDRFEKVFPDRFYQTFIAEQAMIGAAMGLASRGAIAFPSSFACFLERGADFIRMAGISMLNIKLCGSHAGVSIGEDGPSQMALEDLSMARSVPNCTVLYPSDAVCAERLVAVAAATHGPVYIRSSRPKTPVIYAATEMFPAGGSKIVRHSGKDVATVVAAGVTLFEALKAHDLLAKDGLAIRVIDAYSIQPIDRDGLIAAGQATGGRMFTVEDHYAQGGLGDAVSEAVWDQGFRVQRLAVRETPRSGEPDDLLDRYGISAAAIVMADTALEVVLERPGPLSLFAAGEGHVDDLADARNAVDHHFHARDGVAADCARDGAADVVLGLKAPVHESRQEGAWRQDGGELPVGVDDAAFVNAGDASFRHVRFDARAGCATH